MMTYDCKDWTAWHDRMHGVEPTLYVTGECMAPTPEYTCTLRRAEPQGTNPRDLLLKLVMTPPGGDVPQVLTPCFSRYEEKTRSEYDTVSIIEVQTGIPVKQVS
jgi:hypothetical protein